MVKRKLIRIDDEKCTGCGRCLPPCGDYSFSLIGAALTITNGKAKLIHDKYCNNLWTCIRECPQEAISIEEREAEEISLIIREASIANP